MSLPRRLGAAEEDEADEEDGADEAGIGDDDSAAFASTSTPV